MLRTHVGFLFAVAIGCQATQAQNLEWVQQFGSAAWDSAYPVATDSIGNIYVGGETRGSLGTPNAGGFDFYLRKYDATGALHWSTQVGTNFDEFTGDLSADGFGNIYFAGTWGQRFGVSNSDGWLGKYDASGALLWSRQIGTAGVDGSSSVETDGQGNVYIVGWTDGNLGGVNAGDLDAFLRKYDSSGNLEWTRQFGTSDSDVAGSIAVDGNGNIFVAGETEGSLAGANAGQSDVFLTMFDADGTQWWTQQLGSDDFDWPLDISTGEPGSIYMTGYAGGDLGGVSAGDDDAFLMKYDSGGNLQWIRQFGSDLRDGGRGVHADGLGNVFVSGYTQKSQVVTGDAVFLSQFDASGLLVWTEELSTNANERGGSLSADGRGHLYVTGSTRGSLGGPNLGDYDGFLAKYSVVPEPSSFALWVIGIFLTTRQRTRR